MCRTLPPASPLARWASRLSRRSSVPPTSKPHEISVKGLAPTLVVSTVHDPATPYQAGVDLAKELGGSLLTFDGTQHTVVFQGNSCVDDHAAGYLVNGNVPEAGAKC